VTSMMLQLHSEISNLNLNEGRFMENKNFDKGTIEYKDTFKVCKHCNGNGRILKDISKKSVRYINKAIQYKRSLIEGAKETVF